MKKLLLIIALFTFPIVGFVQEIFISKDSLSLFANEATWEISDTFYIKNIGDSILYFYSIKTNHLYSYKTKVNYSDTIFLTYIDNYRENQLNPLLPLDSMEIVLYAPDLCPICKTSHIKIEFTDSILIYTNSISDSGYIISVKGDGYLNNVIEKKIISESFALKQNYPNPFNPTNTIKYSFSVAAIHESPKRQSVLLKVYDILGKEVVTLVNEKQKPGNYQAIFDASNLASGVYYYQLKVGNFIETKKMILLR